MKSSRLFFLTLVCVSAITTYVGCGVSQSVAVRTGGRREPIFGIHHRQGGKSLSPQLANSDSQTTAALALLADDPVEAALEYLRREMDTFHRRTIVYDDHESGGERFIPSGWMKGPGVVNEPEAIKKFWEKAGQELSLTHPPESPHSGSTCFKINWKPGTEDEWMGVYWQNPEDNWGEYPGLDLQGASSLTFWARGETGGEVV
ncbi:MAG: hypothetical protein IAG10_31020, partial [Planctomycetaceae bacterium]|nr:hypothetical protein [Planctomycetaceae bacterium]